MKMLDQPIGTLARIVPGATAVFHLHHLNFCCGGDKTLRQAAQERQLDAHAIATELSTLTEQQAAPAQRLDTLEDAALIEHIVSRYHDLHRQQLPELIRLSARVELVHRGHPRCPVGLTRALYGLQDALEEHMRREEEVLFPMIARDRQPAALQPIAAMRREHDGHGKSVEAIADITGNFELPQEACGSWRALYSGLEALCRDLQDHIHLENNILFNRIDGQLEELKHG